MIRKCKSFESLVVKLKYNSILYNLVAIYRPPAISNVKTFVTDLKTSILKEFPVGNLCIIGDININTFIRNNDTAIYLDCLSSYGLENCNTDIPTREDHKNNSTNIDHILIRIKNSCVNTGVIQSPISDHYPMFFSVRHSDIKKTDAVLSESVSFLDSNKVTKLISRTNWSSISEMNTVDDIFENFHKTFASIYNKCTYKARTKKARRPYQWLTKHLLNMCSERDHLYKLWKRKPNDPQRESMYKKFRNQVTKRLFRAKNEFYRKKFAENFGNPKKTWETINDILGRKKKSSHLQLMKMFNNNASTVANAFADSFDKNVKCLINNCNNKLLKTVDSSSPETIFLAEASEEEIYNILNNLSTNKSPGCDDIRALDLKNNKEILLPLIKKMINLSIEQGKLPDTLKKAYIKPIFKGGKQKELANYRPISILSSIAKIIEEVMVIRTQEFLAKHKIINCNQYAYQAGTGTNKLLGDFSSFLNSKYGAGNHCLVLFVDFSKAFDTLDHRIILKKAEKIGLRGVYLRWLENYLTNRKACVKIGKSISNTITITQGVPQGSKIGPLLYLIYCNDLYDYLENSTVFAYADDTTLVVSNSDLETATSLMQKEFNTLCKWAHDNGLVINSAKTVLMHLKPQRTRNETVNIYLDQSFCGCQSGIKTRLEVVSTHKYLGIIVDDKLKWKEHTDYIRKKLRSASLALFHLKYCSNARILKQVYHSLAEAYIRYGITAWGNSTYIGSVKKSQQKLFRLFPPSLKNLLLPAEDLYKITMINTYYCSRNYLQKINHEQNTRNKVNGKFKIPRFRNFHEKHTLEVTLPTIFNELPDALLNIWYVHIRKSKLKNHFLAIPRTN